MAIPAGWSATDWAGFKDAQGEPCALESQITVHDLSEALLLTVPVLGFQEGQWNLVGDGEVDRTFDGKFFDVEGLLSPHFDPAVAPTRLVKVRQSTYIDSLGKWLHAYTFTGRITVTNDAGTGTWSISAQDKSSFHVRGVPAQRLAKGALVVEAIRQYLASAGETKFDFPSTQAVNKRLTGDIKFGGDSGEMTPLAAMRRAASLAGCQLFWTGDGVATMRTYPALSDPLYVFPAEALQSVPEFGTDMTTLRNRWTGGGKGGLRADVTATGIYSPDSLAINGKPWSNLEFGPVDDTVGSKTELEKVATNRINELITLSTTARFTVVPFVAADKLDVFGVETPDRSESFVLRDCSVPVAGSSSDGPVMSVGYNHNTRRGGAGRVSIVKVRKKKSKSKKKRKG